MLTNYKSTISIIIAFLCLLVSTQSICIVGYNYCGQCFNLTHCKTCHQFTGLKADGTCAQCSDFRYCKNCSGDIPSLCFTCVSYFTQVNGTCVKTQPCSNFYCVDCPVSVGTCQLCDQRRDRHGLYNNDCVICFQVNCAWCPYDASNCHGCDVGYGLHTLNGVQTCSICTDVNLNCALCSRDIRYCEYCHAGYGVNKTATNRNCSSCAQSTCTLCGHDYQVCQECIIGYGLTHTGCYPCRDSPVFCQDCSNTNLLICYSCPPQRFLHNQQCFCIPLNCYQCSDNVTCDVCNYGFYRDPNATCIVCPNNCDNCSYNSNYSTPQCFSCSSDLFQLVQQPGICRDVCGDYIVIQNPCENQMGILLDGCNDQCQVQPYFVCPRYSNGTYYFSQTCYYTGPLYLQLVSSSRQRFANKITLNLKLSPPLNAFKLISQQQIENSFSLDSQYIKTLSIKFNHQTKELQIQCQFSAHLVEQHIITVRFKPMNAQSQQYFSFNYQRTFTFTLEKKYYYYTDFILTMSKLNSLYVWIIIALAWLSCILGVVLRRLAGLQAFFVLQFFWLCMTCIESPFILLFQELYPCKYAFGFSYPFLPENSNSGNLISQFRYSSIFMISRQYLANNFNFNLVLNLAAIIVIISTTIKVRNYIRDNADLREKPQKMQQLQKIVQTNQFTYQILMCSCLVNIVYFISCSIFFFRYGAYSNIPSLVVFSIEMIIIVITLIKFAIDPYPFDYFRFSFKSTQLAMRHYFLYILFIICTISTLILLPAYGYIPLAFPSIMMVYTLAYRPYKQLMENLRSAFNHLVLCSLIMFNVYFQKLWRGDPNQTISTIMFMANVYGLLPVIILISFLSTIYYFYYYKYVLPKSEMDVNNLLNKKSLTRKKFLIHLIQINDANSAFKKIIKDQNIFKQIINPNISLYDASHTLRQLKRMKESGILAEEQMKINFDNQINFSSQRPLKVQVFQQITSNTYKQMKNMVKAEQISRKLKEQNKIDDIYNEFDSKKQTKTNNNLITGQKEKEKNQSRQKAQGFNQKQMRVINRQKPIPQQDYGIAQKILVDEGKFIEMRGAFDKVVKQMKGPADPNADLFMSQFEKINAHVI